MQLPRCIPFFLALGFLLAAPRAQAAKPFPRPIEVQRPVPAADLHGGPSGCVMGVAGSAGTVTDFIYPWPDDDLFYTLLDVRQCAGCATADSATFTRVHVTLQFRVACELPIAIGLVGAGGTATCPTPNLADVRYPLTDFTLPAVAPTPPAADTIADLVFDLPTPALVVGRAFLVVSFLDTLETCNNPASTKPRMVMLRSVCTQCRSYNDWFGTDGVPDDLCFPDPVGNPLMSVEMASCFPLVDLEAPAAVGDLAQDSTAFDAVRLTWTAPGDDGTSGTAHWYEVRRATAPINDGNFESADSLAGAPVPSVAGSRERFLVTGLSESSRYWFALKAHDEGGNESALSNVLSVTTSPGIPAPVGLLEVTAVTSSTVRLRWRASGDDGIVGRPLRYLIAVSTSPITAASFYASLRDSVAASVDAGGQESFEVAGLLASTDYHIAVRARDDLGNVSDVVAIAARTEPGGPFPPGRVGPAIAPLQQPARLPVPIYWLGTAGEPRQSIRIYDLGGRLVRTLPLAADAAGVEAWDGLSDDGRKAQPGLYVAKLVTGSRTAKSRIVLLK